MLLQYKHFSELYELCCFLVVPFSQFFSMYSHLFEGGGSVVEWPSHSPTLLQHPLILSLSLLLACISCLFVLIPTHWSFTQNKSFPRTGHTLRTSHSHVLVIHLEQFIPTHHPHTTHIYVSPCIGHAQEGSLYIGLPVLASVELLYYLALTNIHF